MTHAMPLMSSAYPPGQCLEWIGQLPSGVAHDIALAEYHYFRAEPEQAASMAEPYLDDPDFSHRLSAQLIFGYANLALDRIEQSRLALIRIQETVSNMDSEILPENRALILAIATTAKVLLHLPIPREQLPLVELLPLLPRGIRQFSLYVQAHQAYLDGDYGKAVGIVETALALQDQIYPIPTIYLHLMGTMAYMSLKDASKAKAHLLAAWNLARPDGLLQPFAEHHGLLGGTLEVVIKKEWPEDFRRIIAITYRFAYGWRRIHNPVTGHDVADDLTTTEFAIGMLAARGWSNKEISTHLGVSAYTVKQHLSAAFRKLGITTRKELGKYMLL